MKYIGSGLWAIAAAYTKVAGYYHTPVIFFFVAIIMAMLGSNKSLVTINNQAFVDKGGNHG